MFGTRQLLPAWAMKDELVKTINAHQVVVIRGDTGNGESTHDPQFILDHWMEASVGAKSAGKFDNECRTMSSYAY